MMSTVVIVTMVLLSFIMSKTQREAIVVSEITLLWSSQTAVHNLIFFFVIHTGITVQFSEPLYSTLESTGMLQATLVSSLPLSTDYRVRVRFRPRTATSKSYYICDRIYEGWSYAPTGVFYTCVRFCKVIKFSLTFI